MSKVRIDEPGWSSFSDWLGSVQFENGVSTRELTEREIAVIASNLKIVKVDTDEQIGLAVTMANTSHLSAEVKVALQRAPEPKVTIETSDVPPTTFHPIKVESAKHTKESLEALADEGGIKAVRKIADEYDVKGVQIAKMIDEILEAQSKDI
jgi:hypothetical protein